MPSLADAARGVAQSSVSFTEAVNADLKMSEPPPQGRSGAPEHSPQLAPKKSMAINGRLRHHNLSQW
jgi:hypothetical protein